MAAQEDALRCLGMVPEKGMAVPAQQFCAFQYLTTVRADPEHLWNAGSHRAPIFLR